MMKKETILVYTITQQLNVNTNI